MSMKNKNCLQVAKFYPPIMGGIESTVKDISEGLTRRGWCVAVLCSNTENKTIISKGRILIVRAAALMRLASTSISPCLIKFLMRIGDSAEILHVHLPNPMANLAIWIVRPRVKIILHWHSDIVKQKTLLKFYVPLQQWLLNRSKLIICTSMPYAKSSKWLENYQSKIRILPSCIGDPLAHENSHELSKRVVAIKDKYFGKKIIFSLGRMTYYKGFNVLIQAASELPDDMVVLIGGEGELLAGYKKITQDLNLSEKVIFLGKIPQELLSSYYEAADIFCLPSLARSEAFGLVMVEAMAHSLPIVATDIIGSGVPWVNQDSVTGLNVEPGNPGQLASALTKLLLNPTLANHFGKAARKRFEKFFELEIMIDALEEIYREVQTNEGVL